MSDVKVYGDFQDWDSNAAEYLALAFSPSSRPLKERWRNNGLSADFLADYFVSFIPRNTEGDEDNQRQAEVKNAVSYIANELLENAMKFADPEADFPISLRLELTDTSIKFHASNSVLAPQIDHFQAFLDEFLSMDAMDYYVMQMERNVENNTESGLGFASMVNDYGATLGWKLVRPDDPSGIFAVHTCVALSF